MRLTYEQHQELLELAAYLANARRNALRQGMKLDEIVGKNIDQEDKPVPVMKTHKGKKK